MNDIHKATERRKFQLVFEILQKDPSQVHARTTGLVPNNQPLHLAAWQGRKKLAKLFLNAGADINARGDSGRTPLCYAVENDSAALIKLLIERGADLNIRPDAGCTPLYFAAAVGDVKTANLLLTSGAEKDIHSSIYLDGADQVLSRLQADPSIIEDAVRPETLLTDAIRVKSPELAEFLLTHGVNANVPGWSKNTPQLFDAMAQGNADLVRIILEHGADIGVKDDIDRSVLAFAAEFEATDEIINLLKQHGAAE